MFNGEYIRTDETIEFLEHQIELSMKLLAKQVNHVALLLDGMDESSINRDEYASKILKTLEGMMDPIGDDYVNP